MRLSGPGWSVYQTRYNTLLEDSSFRKQYDNKPLSYFFTIVINYSASYKDICKIMHGGYGYIMTNRNKTTLYTGVTSDLKGRIAKHKIHHFSGSFSARYNLEYLIYYEFFNTIGEAIKYEDKLKN